MVQYRLMHPKHSSRLTKSEGQDGTSDLPANKRESARRVRSLDPSGQPANKRNSARRVRLFALVVPFIAALVSAFLLHGSTGLSQVGHAGKIVLTLQRNHPGKEFAPGTIGLSVEARELATSDLSARDRPLVDMMRQLGPGVLRIGGNSLDSSWWTSANEPAPAWAKSVVVPTDVVRLRTLLKATGWRTILGVDLGHFDPTRAANEAQVAEGILGSGILGFEIGNEPTTMGILRSVFAPIPTAPTIILRNSRLTPPRCELACRRSASTAPT